MAALTALANGVRHTVRALRRAPAFTTAALLTLALAIGANTAIFSLVYGVLVRPLPYPDPDRLVHLDAVDARDGRTMNFSLVEFADWQRQVTALDLALFAPGQFSLSGDGDAEAVRGAVVSDHFFAVLGVPAAIGRHPGPVDDGSAVAVISHGLWQRRFRGSAAVVGRRVLLNGDPYTIIGVAAQAFRFPAAHVDLWVPVGYAKLGAPPQWRMRGFRAFSMIGRLKPGATMSRAADELSRAAHWLSRTYPRFNDHLGASATPLGERLTAAVRPVLLLLFAAVGLVLLAACANLATLSLARNASRERELAIRMAIGAGRARVVGQLVAESATLAVAGAGLGVLAATWSLALLGRVGAGLLPRLADVRLDAPVLLFALGTTMCAVLAFGLLPALHATRARPSVGIDGARAVSSGRIRRLHGLGAGVQMAISLLLLVGATLLARSLTNLAQGGAGVSNGSTVTLKMDLTGNAYNDSKAQTAFLDRVLSKVSMLPGVRYGGLVSSLPPHVTQMHTTVPAPNPATGRQQDFAVEMVAVSPDAFSAIGVPLLRGRPFQSSDAVAGGRVVILSEDAARRLFPGVDAIGRRLEVGPTGSGDASPEVVGVVGNVRYSGLDVPPDGAIYQPYWQRPFRTMYLAVRTVGEPLAVAGSIRQIVAREDPTLALSDVRTLDALVSEASAGPRIRLWLLGLLTGLALLMSAVGLSGVMAYAVSERTREIGVRMAVGARPADVVRLMMAQGLGLTAAGGCAGIVTAFAFSRAIGSFLYGVEPTDAGSYAFAAGFVLLVGALATSIPAYRATRVDPLVALRGE